MPQDSNPQELLETLNLPHFSDRLPDLIQNLRQVGEDLSKASPHQSYLPYWEDLYASSHSLKGVLNILRAPAPISSFVNSLTEILHEGLTGEVTCRRNLESAEIFSQLSLLLENKKPEDQIEDELHRPLKNLVSLFTLDLRHEDRLKDIPAHLFYVNEFVSKKAREITLLNLNNCAVEDEILLDEIPLWRTQLNEALQFPEFGRGIIVNFLPFLSPEGSRKLKVWAWVAAPSHSRAALKQRIKEVMPKVTIAKV
jgi:hypothetical protein